MARRRKSSLIEELFELVVMLPWWAGVLIAISVYFGLHIYASQPIAPITTTTQISGSILKAVFMQVAGVVQYVLPVICLLAAAASAWKASKRKSLLQGVTSSKSAASLEAITWQEFEQLVGEAFRQKGYQVKELGGAGPDGGIDLLLTKGSEITLVQCKQWKAFKVGVDVVRSLYGVMAARGAANGIVVTSGKFTADAQEFAFGRNVKLLAGEELFGMLKSAKVEITRQEATQAKTVAAGSACPACGSAMVRRQGKRGTNAGNYFWGCATFPTCRGTASS